MVLFKSQSPSLFPLINFPFLVWLRSSLFFSALALQFPSPRNLPDPGMQSHLLCLLLCKWVLYPLSHQGRLAPGWMEGRKLSGDLGCISCPQQMFKLFSALVANSQNLQNPPWWLTHYFPSHTHTQIRWLTIKRYFIYPVTHTCAN